MHEESCEVKAWGSFAGCLGIPFRRETEKWIKLEKEKKHHYRMTTFPKVVCINHFWADFCVLVKILVKLVPTCTDERPQVRKDKAGGRKTCLRLKNKSEQDQNSIWNVWDLLLSSDNERESRFLERKRVKRVSKLPFHSGSTGWTSSDPSPRSWWMWD